MKWIIGLLCLVCSQSAWAAGAINITAERMRMDSQHHQADFSGGVHLTRDDFQLWCDHLTVYYQGNALQKAIADGRVRIQQGKKRGASEHAIFTKETQLVVLTGHASVEDEQGVVRGDKIIHHLDTQETSVVQSSNQPVHLHIDSNRGVTKP